jgi:hypothetical protein
MFAYIKRDILYNENAYSDVEMHIACRKTINAVRKYKQKIPLGGI